ncbi:hypothetical protein [Nannocystis pusilla]
MSTNARPQGGPGSVFLIDGNNFIFRAFHAMPSLSAPGACRSTPCTGSSA